MTEVLADDVARLLPARKGHFRLESGHHGDTWLDLELLCLHPEPVRRLAKQLAARLTDPSVEVVCGPLVEGAFVALLVALELDLPFTYTERIKGPPGENLFPVRYRLPAALRDVVRGKRVAIVNDVINAGSAVRGTFADLTAWGASPVVLGTLAVLGSSAYQFAQDIATPLETLASFPNEIWTASQCPLCAAGVPLTDYLFHTGTAPIETDRGVGGEQRGSRSVPPSHPGLDEGGWVGEDCSRNPITLPRGDP